MLPLFILLAASGPAVLPPIDSPIREIRQGPMQFEWRTLSQPHPYSDDRMFPDIAVKDLRIDGDILYVRLVNQGGGGARVPIAVVARAASGGMKSDEVQAQTSRLAAGESRWVALRGFSVRSAGLSAPVFDLASATSVSAAAWLLPTTAGNLDRSGQGCGECSTDADEKNNILSLNGSSIVHGRPVSASGK